MVNSSRMRPMSIDGLLRLADSQALGSKELGLALAHVPCPCGVLHLA